MDDMRQSAAIYEEVEEFCPILQVHEYGQSLIPALLRCVFRGIRLRIPRISTMFAQMMVCTGNPQCLRDDPKKKNVAVFCPSEMSSYMKCDSSKTQGLPGP